MGSVLLSATIFVLINILADVLYGIIDPRIKMK
jgi:peptide/nickel transport system permease protein